MDITATPDTLMRQAHMTAHDYMMYAKADIDELFGAGYAAQHTDLVAAYMTTAAADFHTAISAQAISAAAAKIEQSIDFIPMAIEDGLVSMTSISEAIDELVKLQGAA
jgi:hypothetical protein